MRLRCGCNRLLLAGMASLLPFLYLLFSPLVVRWASRLRCTGRRVFLTFPSTPLPRSQRFAFFCCAAHCSPFTGAICRSVLPAVCGAYTSAFVYRAVARHYLLHACVAILFLWADTMPNTAAAAAAFSFARRWHCWRAVAVRAGGRVARICGLKHILLLFLFSRNAGGQ